MSVRVTYRMVLTPEHTPRLAHTYYYNSEEMARRALIQLNKNEDSNSTTHWPAMLAGIGAEPAVPYRLWGITLAPAEPEFNEWGEVSL